MKEKNINIRSRTIRHGEDRDRVVGSARGDREPAWPSRARHGVREREVDRAWLGWVARFRFVTVTELVVRFDVSMQQARGRVRRLVDAGLVARAQPFVSQAASLHVTRAGFALLGLAAPTRPPRVDVQREHELALAGLVARLEREAPDLVVLTDRDARRAEATTGRRYSVTVMDERGRSGRRWPDLLLHGGVGLVAVELELTLKSRDRLRRIVDGYAASDLEEVRWLVGSVAIARRIRRLSDLSALPSHAQSVRTPRVVIEPWNGVDANADHTTCTR